MSNVNIAEAFKKAFGGTTKAANTLGVSAQVVSNWYTRGVPAEQCPLIEKATNGALRCEDLRPDIAWDVVRNGAPHLHLAQSQ